MSRRIRFSFHKAEKYWIKTLYTSMMRVLHPLNIAMNVKSTVYPKAYLKKGKEKVLESLHPWIFSGAFSGFPACKPGDIVEVVDHGGRFCAWAYLNPTCSIAARILSFHSEEKMEALLSTRLATAWAMRKQVLGASTDAFRWVQAEGDGLPGLVIDVYGDVFVLQISTQGMERLRDPLLHILETQYHPRGIFEKSSSASRKLEGLSERIEWVKKPESLDVLIHENGIRYQVDIERGQKTGFFLDQRDMRQLVHQLSRGLDVINCYAYSGGFSLQALAGGANRVMSVDSSKEACELLEANIALNGPFVGSHETQCHDSMEVLQSHRGSFDLVILDPPAFVKREKDKHQGRKKYLALNRTGIKAIKEGGGYLLTASCSYFMDESVFLHMLMEACKLEGKTARILSTQRTALDHPSSLYHREGAYLKSLLLYVS